MIRTNPWWRQLGLLYEGTVLQLMRYMPCGCRESSSIVSCGDLILVDETAESVVLANRAEVDAVGRLERYGLAGGALIKGAGRSMGVVVFDVDLQHTFEVAPAEDEQPVQRLPAQA